MYLSYYKNSVKYTQQTLSISDPFSYLLCLHDMLANLLIRSLFNLINQEFDITMLWRASRRNFLHEIALHTNNPFYVISVLSKIAHHCWRNIESIHKWPKTNIEKRTVKQIYENTQIISKNWKLLTYFTKRFLWGLLLAYFYHKV